MIITVDETAETRVYCRRGTENKHTNIRNNDDHQVSGISSPVKKSTGDFYLKNNSKTTQCDYYDDENII